MQDSSNQLTDKQKRKIRRHLAVNDIAVREELNLLDDKIEETSCEMCDKIDSISEQLHEKIEEAIEIATETQKMEGASGYTPIKGVDYNDGEDGEDYILTDQDKKEIASLITVPTLEKVIEKTEIIKEQPIVTEITKEIKIENPFELEGEDIVEKINELPIDNDDYKIDASHIKNLPKATNAGSKITNIINRETTDTTVTELSSNTTLSNNGLYLAINPITITLPQIFTDRKKITISNQSSGEVTILASSGDLVHDDTSMIMRYTNSTAQLVSSSLGWVVI